MRGASARREAQQNTNKTRNNRPSTDGIGTVDNTEHRYRSDLTCLGKAAR